MELATVDPNQALSGFVFYECPAPSRDWVREYPRVELRVTRMSRLRPPPLAFTVGLPLSQ